MTEIDPHKAVLLPPRPMHGELERVLRDANLLCDCGERIRAGVELIAVGPVAIPPIPGVGEGQTVGAVLRRSFCSRTCVAYAEALREGLPAVLQTPVGAVQAGRVPVVAATVPATVQWFGEDENALGGLST